MSDEKLNNKAPSFPSLPATEPKTPERSYMEAINVSDDYPANIEAAVQGTERLIEIFRKVRDISLKLTREENWSFQGDGLYLDADGCRAIAVAWGVDVMPEKIDRQDFQDEGGAYFVYTCVGTAFSKKLGRMVREIGTCSSRDDFFGKETITDDKGKREKVWKQIGKVDVTDIMKKAVTNFTARAIKAVIGLGGIDEETLKLAGLKTDKIERINYGEGRKTAEANASPALLKMRGEIHAIAEFLAHGDAAQMRDLVKAASSFKPKDGDERFFTDPMKCTTERWAETTLGRIKGKLKEQAPEEYARRYPEAGQGEAAAKPAAKPAPASFPNQETEQPKPGLVPLSDAQKSTIIDLLTVLGDRKFSNATIQAAISKRLAELKFPARQIQGIEDLNNIEAEAVIEYLKQWVESLDQKKREVRNGR